MKRWFYIGLSLLAAGQFIGACHFSSTKVVEIHAHRGGAAIYPENTILAMKHAVEIGVPTLELDLHITKDKKVVVSHDAYLNADKVLTPEGLVIPKSREREYKIYAMDYDSLRCYDVGTRVNPAFPNVRHAKCSIPLVSELIDSIENYVAQNKLPAVNYNIEIKSDPAKDNLYSPDYKTFADLCMQQLLAKKLGKRLLVQCFDIRTLNYLHQKYSEVRLSYLVEDRDATFSELMSRLTFTPEVISPENVIVNKDFVTQSHDLGMKVAPWTVDDKQEIMRLVELKVDAIITNQPDSVMYWLGL